jgi:GalNAc-alpha-(1->4)-GalNAc-alpha-(1->3)-diNAcBac-PP-undecaprenol alpha-1,4-N-acetyl-D-galactosaminyltransferase
MKIILLTSSLGPGGAERVATTLCNFWAARGDRVFLIPTFSGGGEVFYAVSPAVKVTFLATVVQANGKNKWGYVNRLYRLRALIAEAEPDVIVSLLPNVNVAAILSTLLLRIPLIICERSDPSIQPIPWFWSVARRLLYRFADMLTVQTAVAATRAKSFFPQSDRIRVIPNPVPEGVAFSAKRQGNERRKLISIGRLAPEKQVASIINAFSELVSKFDDWHLDIYGDGPLRPALQSQIASIGLQSRVFLRGRTDEPWEVMASSDVFVMASRYEGFPNSLLEAMGVGLPCIAFDCPSGPREISNNGEYAVLVPLNDQAALVAALSRLMSDDCFRNSLGSRAREAVLSRFALPVVMDGWDQLFREVGAIR